MIFLLGLPAGLCWAEFEGEIEQSESVNLPEREKLHDIVGDWYATLGKSKEEKERILNIRKAERARAWAEKQRLISNSNSFDQFKDWLFTLGKPKDERNRIIAERNAMRGRQKGAPKADSMEYLSEDRMKEADIKQYQKNLQAKEEAKRRVQESNRDWNNEMQKMQRNKRKMKQ